jgi:hypothetical protein
MEILTKYGLQNVASNFAYDRRQEFFKKPLAIHLLVQQKDGKLSG